MNKRGSLPALVGVAMPMVLVLGTFAVDATRFWLHQARLQTALDAGALIAARNIDDPDRDAKVKAVVVGNYNENARSGTQLTAADVQVTQVGTDKVQVTASMGVTPLLGTAVDLKDLPASLKDIMTASRGATANRTSTGLELALVFDITLSMTASDVGNNKTRIRAAADAGLTLLRILYDDKVIPKGQPDTNKKWAENLFISVVPFATAVNVGAANTHFLGPARTTNNYDNYDVDSWMGSKPTWGGCVEMRALSHNDATPVGAAGLTRYYARSTYDTSKTYNPNLANTTQAQPYCLSHAAYKDTRKNNPSGANNVCMGHNDWRAPAYVFSGASGQGARQNTLITSMVDWSSHKIATVDPWVEAHGPNMMCPPETHRVLPLTRDRATVEALINKIGTVTQLPFSAGTNIAPGLMVGWFTLSPNWRKVNNGFAGWPSAEPAADPQKPRPTLPALPFDYFAQNRRKVLILLTDGDNTWFNAKAFQHRADNTGTKDVNEALGDDGSLKLVRPESRMEEGFYGAYGNLRDHFGTSNDTIAKGVAKMNEASEDWCEAIRTRKPKKNPNDPNEPPGPEQITVYTISFSGGVSQPARTLLSNCASKRANGTPQYWHAPDDKTLQDVFEAIGAELSNLRLTQ